MPGSNSTQRLSQAERTEISDRKMFDVTVRLIIERGTEATSLKDVGLLAGYSRGLAGHRFGSKDALFSFALRRLGEIWLNQLKACTQGAVGYAAVEQALDQHYRFCVEAPDQVRAFYTLWFEAINTETALSEAIQSIHKRRHQDVMGWIRNDPSLGSQPRLQADAIAAQFSASVIGIIYYWLANPQDLALAKTLHDGLKQTMATLLGVDIGKR